MPQIHVLHAFRNIYINIYIFEVIQARKEANILSLYFFYTFLLCIYSIIKIQISHNNRVKHYSSGIMRYQKKILNAKKTDFLLKEKIQSPMRRFFFLHVNKKLLNHMSKTNVLIVKSPVFPPIIYS